MYADNENINDRHIVLRGYKRTDELCKYEEPLKDTAMISKMLHNLGKVLYTVEFLYEDSMPIESTLLANLNLSDEELLEQVMEIEPYGTTLSEIILTSEYSNIEKRFDQNNEYLQLLLMYKRNKQPQITPRSLFVN